MSRSLNSVLSHLLKAAQSPAAVNPLVTALGDADADKVIGSVTATLVQAALDANPVAPITAAQKTLAKASANVRSMALAILALAADRLPDVRAVSGWKAIAVCTDRKALTDAARTELQALTDALLAVGQTGMGTDAPKRGEHSTTLGKGSVCAPTSGQAAGRLLRDVILATAAAANLDAPATNCDRLAATAKALARVPRKSKAAA